MSPPLNSKSSNSPSSPFNQYREGPDDTIMEIELRREQGQSVVVATGLFFFFS